jgi:hypothetical protein
LSTYERDGLQRRIFSLEDARIETVIILDRISLWRRKASGCGN